MFAGFLYCSKFVVFELKSVTNVNTVGEKCNGNFGNYTGIIVTDDAVIATNINNCTDHNYSHILV